MTSSASTWVRRFLAHATPQRRADSRSLLEWAAEEPQLAEDPKLLEEVVALLELNTTIEDPAGDRAKGSGLHTSLFRTKSATPKGPPLLPGFQPGRVVGGHRLERIIGSGGMGQVWLARDTALKRPVALKVVRPDRITPLTLKLFAREARAGGRLQHPGLVQVLSHGEDDGVAWIAMEYVDGSWTLRDFLDEAIRANDLPADYYQKVATFTAKLADALHTAHEGGVIHRDLKPQNILVTRSEEPKVTDFGLARITDESMLSKTGDFAGTYAYMSPEQVAARRIGLDHRSDIFSLGIVLYEMLSMRRPFDGDSAAQVGHQIMQKEPLELRSLRSRIPRDLEVICGKCLEKDRDRRYASMADLASDLRRHLSSEPILARPPGRLRKLELWARRHPARTVAAALTAAATVIVGGFAVENSRLAEERAEQARIAKENYEAAQDALTAESQRAAELSRVAGFQSEQFARLDPESLSPLLRVALFEGLEPAQAEEIRGALAGVDLTGAIRSTLGANLFDAAIERANRDFEDVPGVRIQLLEAIGEQLMSLGYNDAAFSLWGQIVALREEHDGPEAPATGRALLGQALAADGLADFRSMQDLARSALDRLPREGDRETIERVRCVARITGAQAALGSPLEGIELGMEWINDPRAEGIKGSGAMLELTRSVAICNAVTGKLDEAVRLLEQGVDQVKGTPVFDSEDGRVAMADLGMLLGMLGRTEDALRTSELAVESTVRAKGALHRDSLMARGGLLSTRFSRWQGSAFANDGEAPALAAEALGYAEELIPDIRLSMGERSSMLASALSTQGLLLNGLGRPAEALPVLSESLSISKTSFPPGHPSVLQSELNLGQTLFELKRFGEALDHFTQVRAAMTAADAQDLTIALAFYNEGYALAELRRFGEAEAALLEGHRRLLAIFGEGHMRPRKAAQILAELYERWDSRPDAAEQAARWKSAAGD
ncbi:serine/threonine-protein kinase [Planctomycetota bacterium]|nr:serine/threonine-protein kinase [Planctomycetota bacterium]